MVRTRVLTAGATALMLLALLAILVPRPGRSPAAPNYVDGATSQRSGEARDPTASIESPSAGASRNEVRPPLHESEAAKPDDTPSPAGDDIDLELSSRDL